MGNKFNYNINVKLMIYRLHILNSDTIPYNNHHYEYKTKFRLPENENDSKLKTSCLCFCVKFKED